MLAHARAERPMECCGLLAGRDGVITDIFPAENILASGTAYAIAPRDLFRLFRTMRSNGLEHLGIYHSHPSSENVPSASDIAQAYYPGQAYFIVSPGDDARKPVRAFSIRDVEARELDILVEGTQE